MGGPDSEQFEVLDEQGHKTGQLLERKAVHEQQLWHEAVNVWIINSQGEVLLQLRGPNIDVNPGVWDVAIGTHVRPHEDPANAALRCLQDELGVTVTADQLKHLFNIQSANPAAQGRMHRTLSHLFLLKQDILLTSFRYDTTKIAQLIWKPLVSVMAEVGGQETKASYYPRAGDYYPKLFEALQAEM